MRSGLSQLQGSDPPAGKVAARRPAAPRPTLRCMPAEGVTSRTSLCTLSPELLLFQKSWCTEVHLFKVMAGLKYIVAAGEVGTAHLAVL